MNRYLGTILLFFCIICHSANSSSTGTEKRSSSEAGISILVDKAERLLLDGKYKQAIDILEKALSDGRLAGMPRGRATMLLARAQRLDGSPAKSIKTLEKLIETKDPLHYVEMAEAYLALLKPEEALRSASMYGPKDASDVLVYVYWVGARVEFSLENYLRCIESCKGTLREIDSYRGKSDTNKKTVEEFVTIAKAAAELMERAQEMYDASRYGTDFAYYRKARHADFKGEYDDAIKYYSKIRKGVLLQAAALYIGKCLEAKGEEKESLRKFKEIIENDPASPYAGEASLKLVENIYIKSGAEEALKHAAWFDEWIVKEEKLWHVSIMLDTFQDSLSADSLKSVNYFACF